MTEKLTIVINGLEYVAKSNQNNDLYYMNRELLLNDELTKLRNEIKTLEADLGLASYANEELERANDNLIGECQALSIQINELEEQVAELEEENGNIMCKYNELEEAMNDILCVARQFV